MNCHTFCLCIYFGKPKQTEPDLQCMGEGCLYKPVALFGIVPHYFYSHLNHKQNKSSDVVFPKTKHEFFCTFVFKTWCYTGFFKELDQIIRSAELLER